MKPKRVNTSNPLFMFIEGEGMCEEGMLEIQQQRNYDDEWHCIRIPYEEVPLLIRALQSKMPVLTEKNSSKWDNEVLNRVQ
jgi:hypothetical protein